MSGALLIAQFLAWGTSYTMGSCIFEPLAPALWSRQGLSKMWRWHPQAKLNRIQYLLQAAAQSFCRYVVQAQPLWNSFPLWTPKIQKARTACSDPPSWCRPPSLSPISEPCLKGLFWEALSAFYCWGPMVIWWTCKWFQFCLHFMKIWGHLKASLVGSTGIFTGLD